MQQKHRTFYLLNDIRALAFGKERELKNEVSLRCFIFFFREILPRKQQATVRKAHKQLYSNKTFQFHRLTL